MWTDKTLTALGTRCRFLIAGDKPHQLITRAITQLSDYETIFSAHSPTSELNRINQAAGHSAVPVSKELFDLIAIGKDASLNQPSRLNIALGALIKAWHIGFDDAKKPDQQTIDQLLSLSRPEDIQLNQAAQTVFLTKPGMSLDLGALAKGYIADLISADLKANGATAALLDFGGNILTYGQSFHIGIQHPFAPRGQTIGTVNSHNQALVTSGTYERFFQDNGRAYHHILDPQTGYPIKTDMASLSILAPTALAGEIWTSKLFGLDRKTTIQLINQEPGIEGLILTEKRCQLSSKGFQKQFKPYY